MYQITGLYVYPIKSLGAVTLSEAELSETGFAYDRFWMLVDEVGNFLTQRVLPILARFEVALTQEHLQISFEGSQLKVPKILATPTEEMDCQVFGIPLKGALELPAAHAWFSEQLGRKVFLLRKTLPRRAVKGHEEVSINFSDTNQYLLLGTASLEQLNSKLETPVPMNRFRPNIVFEGGTPHLEDEWQHLQIGTHQFASTKLCGRCKVITVNQETAEVGKEPLKTLATYRTINQKVCFGQLLKLTSSEKGQVKVGDMIEVLSSK